MCTSPHSSCHLACFCDPANKDVEQHFQSVMHYATFGKAAGWSATWEMTESCVTPSCEVLSGSAFVFMRVACYRWNLPHKCIIYLRGFLPRSQRALSDTRFETLREREVRMGLRMPAVATMPQFLSPETTTTIWLPFTARMHTHTHTHTGDITVRCHGNQPTTLYPECFTAYELQINQCSFLQPALHQLLFCFYAW